MLTYNLHTLKTKKLNFFQYIPNVVLVVGLLVLLLSVLPFFWQQIALATSTIWMVSTLQIIDHQSLHSLFESIAIACSMLLGAFWIKQWVTTRRLFFLILGIGFLFTSLIDIFHVTYSLNPAASVLEQEAFVTSTWALSRTYLTVIVVLSVLLSQFDSETHRENLIPKFVSMAIIITVFASFVLSGLINSEFSLPIVTHQGVIERPYDLWVSGISG